MYQYSQMRPPLRKFVSSAMQFAAAVAVAAGSGTAACSVATEGALGAISWGPPSGVGSASGAGATGVSAVGTWSGEQTVGAKNRSMLMTWRTGSPANWNSRVVSSIQIRADEKKILGTGKKERNTGRLQGVGKMCHLTVAMGIKQGREVKLW